MVSIPIVRSFLGCVDLRVACLVIAAFRLVVSIIALVVLLFVFVILEDETVEASNLPENSDAASFGLLEFLIAVYVAITAVIIVINLITTYWFIQGVTSNKPHKMKYYLWVEQVIIVLFLLSFVYSLLHIERLIGVLVESYIFICSNSLYQECLLGEYNQNADNASENTAIKLDNVPAPAPPYNSLDENMQQTPPQNANPFKE